MKKIITFCLVVLVIANTKSQTLSVDFSNTDTVKNMSGFLHAMDATSPPDSLILPLKPGYWRGGTLTSNIYNRATAVFGAQYILVLSDLWGYPPGWTPPYNDTTGFKEFVDTACAQTSGYPMIYNIWGEPNGNSWAGTQAQFFDIFKMAHNRIRANLGYNVEVCGPSIWNADTTYLRDFCNFCLANNIQLDILSFHWFYNDSVTYLLKEALLWCRAQFIENPLYDPLQIKKIIVTEVIPEQGQYNPAFVLAHYYYLEQGKATGSNRACWNAVDGSGTSNCWNNSINGLLTPFTYNKRAQWWATKSYADMDSIRYSSISSHQRVYSMTGNLESNPNVIRMMIGYYHNTTPLAPASVDITLNNLNSLSSFPSSDSIKIDLYKIPHTGLNQLTQPTFLGQYTYANDTPTIVLPTLPLDTNAIVYADIVSTSTTVGLLDLEESKLNVFPIPAQQTLTVQLSSLYFDVSIYDNFGRVLVSKKSVLDNTVIDCQQFSNGIYILKVTNGETIFTRKFIKN